MTTSLPSVIFLLAYLLEILCKSSQNTTPLLTSVKPLTILLSSKDKRAIKMLQLTTQYRDKTLNITVSNEVVIRSF